MKKKYDVMSRRVFTKYFSALAGCFTASATGSILTGCVRTDIGASAETTFRFPHGIASADPQPDAIMLWTRVVSTIHDDPVSVTLQIADDPDFHLIRIEKVLIASKDTDHTVRIFVDGLQSDRYYHYRFIAPDGTRSEDGRTRTAPAADAERNLNIAVFSCQNFYSGFSNAYRRLINDDAIAPHDQKIDALVHLGDVIYESAISSFPDLDLNEIDLVYDSGEKRGYEKLPSGGEINDRGWPLAITLDDYRFLYKAMLSDPDMREARARYPFIYCWDDHELLNDAWQSYSPAGSIQERKVAANQAWFEYIPAILDQAPIGPGGPSASHDFNNPKVVDTLAGDFDEDYLGLEPNNLSAIRSLTIYRSLKWGRMADLLLVDLRSYRGPRGVPDEILNSPGIPYPTSPVPTDLIRTVNAGRTADNGNPPEKIQFQGIWFDNERKDAPRSSMLGAEQKAWLKRSMGRSTAHWKVFCNSTPMMRFGFDTMFREGGAKDGILWTDSWDGYPLEREEVASFVKDSGITNIVSLTGDRHAHFAGYILDSYYEANAARAMPEFAGAGVSATCRVGVQRVSMERDTDLAQLVSFDGTQLADQQKVAPSLNAWLLHGAAAAKTLSETGNQSLAIEKSVDYANPHLLYADTTAYGYYIARFTKEELNVEFVTIPEPIVDYGKAGPPVIRRVSYTLPKWEQGELPQISLPRVEGRSPLMGLRL